MPSQCPGFESNKSLAEVTIKCPQCGKEIEIFSDELDKVHKCPACAAQIDPRSNTVSS